MKIFIFFVHWAEKLRTFGENISARSKRHFTCPGEESQQNSFFNRKSKFFLNFPRIGKKSRLPEKNVQQGCQNCILCVQRNVLKIIGLFEMIKFLTHFCTISEKFFDILATKLRQGCQNCILRVQGNALNLFVEKHTVLLPFIDFEQRQCGIFLYFFGRMSKLHFKSPAESFEGIQFFEKKSFL